MPLSPPDVSKRDSFADEALTHLDAMYGVACKLTRNPTEAEDLVQDAFVKAMRAREPGWSNGSAPMIANRPG